MANPSFDQVDTMLALAEKLVADAKSAGVAIGIDSHVAALTTLGHAYALAVTDATGVNADAARRAQGIRIALENIEATVSAYHALNKARAAQRAN